MTKQYRHSFVIGRFQGLHDAHVRLIGRARAVADKTTILLGSANEPRSTDNPFTHRERKELLEKIFPGVQVLGIDDFRYNQDVWYDGVIAAIEHAIDSGVKDNEICFVGHHKDKTSFYLDMFPQFGFVEHKDDEKLNATDIRHLWYSQNLAVEDFQKLKMPMAAKKFMFGEMVEDYHLALADEYEAAQAYRDTWKKSPFPPTFVAVDALVRKPGINYTDILLITRKGPFGTGKFAIPGGYLEVKDTLLESTYRELHEECGLLKSDVKLTGKPTVFDDPRRSKRGRMLTHVHEFELTNHLKMPIAGDDAASCGWYSLAAVKAMRGKFFSDHWHILYNMTKGFTE